MIISSESMTDVRLERRTHSSEQISIVAIVVPESVESVESVDRWYLRKPQIFKECPVLLCAH